MNCRVHLFLVIVIVLMLVIDLHRSNLAGSPASFTPAWWLTFTKPSIGVEDYLPVASGAREATIFSKRGSARNQSQEGWSLRKP